MHSLIIKTIKEKEFVQLFHLIGYSYFTVSIIVTNIKTGLSVIRVQACDGFIIPYYLIKIINIFQLSMIYNIVYVKKNTDLLLLNSQLFILHKESTIKFFISSTNKVRFNTGTIYDIRLMVDKLYAMYLYLSGISYKLNIEVAFIFDNSLLEDSFVWSTLGVYKESVGVGKIVTDVYSVYNKYTDSLYRVVFKLILFNLTNECILSKVLFLNTNSLEEIRLDRYRIRSYAGVSIIYYIN